MDAVSPVKTPSGVVALAQRPQSRTGRCMPGPRALVVAAVDVQDPGNLGAIIRVAEAAGATGFAAAGGSANPFGWKALRGSMGSALRLPIASELTPTTRSPTRNATAAASSPPCRATAARCSTPISPARWRC